jgi:NTE family protein
MQSSLRIPFAIIARCFEHISRKNAPYAQPYRAVLVLVVSLFAAPAIAQEARLDTMSRPRIGVALSGGSALGLAHVGVLRYFEEHHIPVDAVAGTSMGGIVGGLYATGLRAEKLQQIALEAPWDDLLRSNPKYHDRPVAEKQAWMRTDSDTTLRLKGNLALPAGLNTGQQLALFLSRHTAAYSDDRSFDALPIPFRCVATDLIKGEPVLLRKGTLPLAMRATMAVPGVFTPVELDDRVLVDGGVFDNIPVDALREMNAQVTIAVSLQVLHPTEKEVNSLTSILRQLVTVVVEANEKRSLKQADLVIAVPLEDFSTSDYDKTEQIIAAGYKAAQSMGSRLERYELNDSEWEQYLRARAGRIKPFPEKGKVISVASTQPGIQASAEDEIHRKFPQQVDTAELETTLTGITAATSLPAAYYSWKDGPEAKGFAVTLQERSEGGVFIRPALLLQASGGEPTRASLRVSAVTYFRDAYKARVLSQLTIGYDPGLRMEYYAPINSKPFFVAPGFLLQRTAIPQDVANAVPGAISDRFAGTFYAGLGTWRFVQWRTGITAGFDRVNREITLNGITSRSTGFANVESGVLYDTQDAETLPARGSRLDATLGYTFRDHPHPYLNASFSRFFPVHEHLGLFVLGRGATSFGRTLGYYDQFLAGGLRDIPAYRFGEFHANTIGSGGGGLAIPIRIKRLEALKPAFAAWHQVARLDLGSRGWETRQSTSIGLFSTTPLGPAGIVLSSTESGKLRFQFVFGRF